MSISPAAAFDHAHLWHPYTQHQTTDPFPVMVKGEGIYLWDEHGKRYMDGISSWWCKSLGHSHPLLAKALYVQAQQLDHVLFGGFTHTPAVALGQALLPLLPCNQQKLFFSDNGSTAVEVALKAALQFHYNRGVKKHKIIAFHNAYHGDTFGAMASSGLGLFTQAFQDQLLEVIRIPVPVSGAEHECFATLEAALQDPQVAAFIFEPLVQGAGGMIMYSAAALDHCIALCQQAGVLTIADEVMTGFGKTDTFFASDALPHKPDMMCLSKALTGGCLPLAITSFTHEVYEGFLSPSADTALLHGHTFTANPLACAVAVQALQLLQSEEIGQQRQQLIKAQQTFVAKLQTRKGITQIRQCGIIVAFDFVRPQTEAYYGDFRNQLYRFFIDKNLIIRPIGSTIYLLPPFITTEQQLNEMHQIIGEAIDQFAIG